MDEDINNEKEFKKKVRNRSIRSFSIFTICVFSVFGIYFWIVNGPKSDGAYTPFRKILNINSKIFAIGYENPSLSKEFPKSIASKRVRVNGNAGMKSVLDTASWKLKIVRFNLLTPLPSDTFEISMDEIKALPKTEVVFNFKCIEGWSQITWWGGVRFSDLAAKYKIGTKNNSIPDTKGNPDQLARYCGLITPDKEYFVGIEMPGMMHPQTILCYEMNGQPLPLNQGAPLRLIIPVKYGVKHLKRIGMIYFSDERPPDYWAIRGYDYFAGL